MSADIPRATTVGHDTRPDKERHRALAEAYWRAGAQGKRSQGLIFVPETLKSGARLAAVAACRIV